MIKTGKNIDKNSWSSLIDKVSTSTFFQTPSCYEFYCSLSFMEAFSYGVEEAGELKGVVCGYMVSNGNRLTKFISRRAIIHGGVLMADDISEDAISALLTYLKQELQQRAIYIEIRNNNDYTPYKKIFEYNGFAYSEHYNYLIDTTDTTKVWQQISKSKQRQIKKAQQQGVTISQSQCLEEVEEFYQVLQNLYKEKIKKPLFPLEFFEKAVSLPDVFLLVSKYHDKIVGGMLCVSHKQTILYEWFVCGEDQEYKKQYPSICTTYAGISYAVEKGFEQFDFMGAGKPDEEYGVRAFKGKFGGKLVENGRFICVNNKFIYRIGKLVIKMVSKK